MSVRTFNRDDSPIALRNTATVVIAATKFMKAISPGRARIMKISAHPPRRATAAAAVAAGLVWFQRYQMVPYDPMWFQLVSVGLRIGRG